MANPVVTAIRQSARRYGIDPRAAVAVALGEGGLVNREGDVGDLSGGGSYGPFQLYAQGALPSQYRGRPKVADTWAWSPEGIDYAVSRMAQAGARGLRGPRAVETIVRKFERPADPDTSVARATSRYGTITPQSYPGLFQGSALAASASPTPGGASPEGNDGGARAGNLRSALLASLLSTSSVGGQERTDPLLYSLLSRRLASGQSGPTSGPENQPGQAAGPAPRGGAYPFNFFRDDYSPLGQPNQGTHSRSERGYLWQDDDAYDYGAPAGTNVYAPAGLGGTVASVKQGSSSGRFGGTKVYLDTPRGQAFLQHLGKVVVKPGQRVSPGSLIGQIGDIPGLSQHLHAAFSWLR